MGEIAEDMHDGSCCELCGQYFKHPKGGIYTHGYPVVCNDCWTELDPQDRKGLVKQDKGIKTF